MGASDVQSAQKKYSKRVSFVDSLVAKLIGSTSALVARIRFATSV